MENVSRRSVLAGACALLAFGAGATPAAAAGGVRKRPDGKLEVNVKQVPELAVVGGVVRVGTIGGVPVAVVRTGQATFKAMSLRCPHQGVTVIRSAQGWECPAHGSQFEPDGDLVLGPAVRSLSKVPLAVQRGLLIVG
jgi:Rieske Fe-S protein